MVSRGVRGRPASLIAVRIWSGRATGVYTGLTRAAITSPWQIQPQSSAFCPLNGHGDMIALEGQRQSTEDGRTRRLKTLGHGDYGPDRPGTRLIPLAEQCVFGPLGLGPKH